LEELVEEKKEHRKTGKIV
jgi:hypothetical protein